MTRAERRLSDTAFARKSTGNEDMVLGNNPTAGTTFPDVKVDIGFLGLDANNAKMTGELNKRKKILWVSLPGAFTPT